MLGFSPIWANDVGVYPSVQICWDFLRLGFSWLGFSPGFILSLHIYQHFFKHVCFIGFCLVWIDAFTVKTINGKMTDIRNHRHKDCNFEPSLIMNLYFPNKFGTKSVIWDNLGCLLFNSHSKASNGKWNSHIPLSLPIDINFCDNLLWNLSVF